MLVTSLNVIALIYPSQTNDNEILVKASGKLFGLIISDVTLLMNYIYSSPSFKSTETWTPLCIPGISEEFMLHIYINYYTSNLGLVFISNDSESNVFFDFS